MSTVLSRALRGPSAALITLAMALTSVAAIGAHSGADATPLKADNGINIAMPLKRIVSLSPTATESLFRIGAGAQVIAVDDQSDFPKNAPRTRLSGYNLNIEAVAAYRPDLVVMTYDPTPQQNALAIFASLRIPVLMQYAADNLADVYSQISELGEVTGKQRNAATVIATMKSGIAKVVRDSRATKRIKVFHEIDSTLYSATSETFIGRVYADLGLVNIADAAASADDYGYPQLSSEYVVKSNPDLILLTDADYGESAKTVAARPGWKNIAAVKKHRVRPVGASISSRWGPRVVDFYRAVGTTVALINAGN